MNIPTPNAAPPAAPPTEKKAEPIKGFVMKNPCLWHILPGEEADTIEAICYESGEKFSGPIKEFNARLRG
jgi:hypothetical protein